MIQKKGTHGTCASYVEEIKEHGFKFSAGRGGTGAYFWRESKHSIKLAKAWYLFQMDRHNYDKVEDNNGAIIIVTITVDNEEFIDIEDTSVKDEFAELLESMGKLNNASDEDICGAWDMYITNIEQETGVKMKLLELRVGVPSTAKRFFSFYSMKALGAPVCFIARDFECIKIENIEEIEDE